MKKVLFYFTNYCGETAKGGTEVATYRIAKALHDYGNCQVYNAFHDDKGFSDTSVYQDVIKLPKTTSPLVNHLSDFIRQKQIDYIVVMGRFFKINKIRMAAKKSGRNPKLFFMHHFAPGSEKKKTTYPASFHLWKLNPTRPHYIFRALFYPLLKLPRTIRWASVYKKVYDSCERIILLSEGYKKEYCKIAKIKDESKFVAIPNIYDLPDNLNDKSFDKQKKVLILSRMDELQKRISLALLIWAEIEKDPDFNGWNLDLVGSGNNNDIVRRLIKKLGLKRVIMHGWQDRQPFLERSPILMMTSEYEGLPLSVLEARAFQCVPIAFNSFASLKDVVTNDINGIIVEKYGDIEEFSNKLKCLMRNEEYHNRLAKNALKGIDSFSSETIAEKWMKILT